MSRKLSIPVVSGALPSVLPINQGGTGQTSAAGVRTKFELVDAAKLGQPNGVAVLIPGKYAQKPATYSEMILEGDTEVEKGDTLVITIVNYDSAKVYNLEAEGGVIERIDDKVYYTAGSEEGVYPVSINGRVLQIPVI